MDQTSMRYVDGDKRGLTRKGTKQVRRLTNQSINACVLHFTVDYPIDQSIACFQYIIKQPPGDKATFTIFLTCQADGTKLPAVVVFAASNKRTGVLSENIMKGLNWEKHGNIVVYSFSKGWWTSRLHERYLDSYFPKGQRKKYLFIDRFPVHKKPEFQFQLEDKNVQQIFVPAGMTGQLQPTTRCRSQ